MRYRIAQANLANHLPPPPAHILDVGGGNGLDVLPLAQQGYTITLVDYSIRMLEHAQREAAKTHINTQFTYIQSDVHHLTEAVGNKAFDVMLCHNILQYLDDADQVLVQLSTHLKAGGLLSIISPNPDSEAYRPAFQQLDLAAAYDQLDTKTSYAKTFQATVRRYTSEELQQWLGAAQCAVIVRYGIRCLCDYLPDNERKTDPAFLANLERLELELRHRYPYYLLARFLHLIAQKDGQG
ncbi:MAG: methyltransferase domain-containing protein [Chloroflexi bacterium AL-W]|nr:methyltransferase domain-containing protein [Chloroflexi bacterium AL-N1]NOK66798.1 methyltransferase domain-containing protein [Chloroflexi bacterium AL-N10]NOK74910.1 methyltransferase domain-containing protein [Chloroflexi bacterium AL-N5]NOK81401.1 methyltransferase domain-containing protein [Chloroflexi bacterium AL-W]NOK88870.1 methyltransferase domain-containing protein [Chloroflexi bacterium AL-N15]